MQNAPGILKEDTTMDRRDKEVCTFQIVTDNKKEIGKCKETENTYEEIIKREHPWNGFLI